MKSRWSYWLLPITFGIFLIISTSSADHETDRLLTDGPYIIPNKNEITLQKGQNYTIKCRGKRPLQIKQQLIPEESDETFRKVHRNLTSTDSLNPYEVILDLYNVDQYAVGYYACFDDTMHSQNVLNDIMEEPTNTEHVTYIYIFVDGTDVILAPLLEFFTIISESKAILRCRPTMPDTEMTLSVVGFTEELLEYENYNPKLGFTLDSDDFQEMALLKCGAERNNTSQSKDIIAHKREASAAPDMMITMGPKYFLAGENFTLNCSVKYQPNIPIALSWDFPRDYTKGNVVNDTNDSHVVSGEDVYNAITVLNATKEDAGNYSCILQSGPKKQQRKTKEKIYLEKPHLTLKTSQNKLIETALNKIKLKFEVFAYPTPHYTYLKDNKTLSINTSKYKEIIDEFTGDVSLFISNLNVFDTANYTLIANNSYLTESITYDLRKKAKPIIDFGPDQDKICVENFETNLRCEATGYPLPNIEWIFSQFPNGENAILKKGDDTKNSEFKVTSNLRIKATTSGNITCKASNTQANISATRQLLVYEIAGGFGVLDSQTWYPESHEVKIRCLASIYKFQNATWIRPDGEEVKENVLYYNSPFSHVAKLKIDEVSLNQAGLYTCVGQYFNGSEEHQQIQINIEALREPFISEPETDRDETVQTFQTVEFSCVANAVPIPNIEWFKDGVLLHNNTDGLLIYNSREHTVMNSTIYISKMNDLNKGKYECMATSEGISKSKFVNLIMEESTGKNAWFSIIGAVVLALIVLVIYLIWKIRKEKKFRKELAAAGLLYFKEGVTRSLNPDLGIDEQAELLPYDEKFEFLPERLILGKQLGAGAFGVVYKAEARGIINAEETTPVAVKMVKKTADNMYIKALASELKIMVHLGKHINIVNLLGACTKNVGKRELIVIVEYCKFGNIHHYMQKHREVFIDQLTDNKEKNLGRVNRGYSCSSGSSCMNSDYFGLNHTQATDHTSLNTVNTNRSGRKDKQNQQEEFVKVSETGYVQPEWRTNYESDYSFDGRNPRPLCSRDLLAWAFQIARGMEYLASRKVLHGDLAARNVLLAEDNVVKICDFGLARSIYKNDEYLKKENSPLPVKWLAIECMMDRIFSTQSDVWSFGIVLWEMFSLAKTPYPNMSPQHLLKWLTDGHRLEKPPYADDKLYDVMKRCWEHKPVSRPSFSQLQELLGSFLEDNVRNHYVDLNSTNMDFNKNKVDQEDYLAMMCSPDYNNLVTPSPHHYMNDGKSFFPPTPTQVPLDEEGYLQMTPANPSIFSPRTQSTKFDFDSRKLEPRASGGGTELTPMLTLNNLSTRSGSESDQEGGHSPYLNMCPKITEESDDVFQPHQNNLKNIQNRAVTNPTYITLDIEGEKKAQDINTYINVPNGLVK